jgi:hypothetical protein
MPFVRVRDCIHARQRRVLNGKHVNYLLTKKCKNGPSGKGR